MKIKAVLFDLDGTLLPMDQDVFVKAYFGGLARALAPRGYEPTSLINAIWLGTGAMVKNDGKETNEEAFWRAFSTVFGEKVREDEPYFDAFYRSPDGFDKVRDSLGYRSEAGEVVRLVKSLGLRPILATNPIFPSIATEKRISWAGLSTDDFELFTTYENSHFCKPNLAYYEEILEKTGLTAEECLMVGNDVGEDMICEMLGMKVFLLTDCLINKTERSVGEFSHGSFAELIEFLKKLD